MCVHTQKCLSLYVPIHCLYVEFTAQSLNAHQTFLQLHVLCLHLLKWHLWIALIYDPGYERNVSLCAGPQQKHNTSGSDITLLYMMYIQYKLICVISAANTSSESANRGAMGTTDDLTKPNNRWCWFTVRTMCYVCYHIHIYMMSPQTGPRPKQTGSLSLSLTRLLSIFYSLPPCRNVPEQPAQSAWPQVTDVTSIQVYNTMWTTQHLNFCLDLSSTQSTPLVSSLWR